jgi:phosphoribosylanthranilate isomerase
MPTLAKICGLSTPDAVQAALDGRAAFLGFVFFAKSPRALTPDLAAELARPVRGEAKIVAVTVDPDNETLDRIATLLAPDLIQLHGKETPFRVSEIKARTGAGVIKALPVSEARDLRAAADYDGLVDYLMFDAKPPTGSDLPGGVGARFDWTLLKDARFERPWFLAGGLDPWNVAEAAAASGAPMVDVSSGVERGPGLKDPRLIAAFLTAVQTV